MRSIIVRPEDGFWYQMRTQPDPAHAMMAFPIKPVEQARTRDAKEADEDRPSQLPTWPPISGIGTSDVD
jgi:hypothetical protein